MMNRLNWTLALLIAGGAAIQCRAQHSDKPAPNPQSPNWTSALPMHHARAAHAVAATAGAIYALAGTGDNSGAPVLEVERFDGKSWSDETRLPGEGLNAPAAVALNDKIYLIGGFGTVTNVPTSDVHVYDVKSKLWSKAADLPAPRGGHAAVLMNGLIHVLGGGNTRSTIADHSVFDPATDRWTERAPLPHAEGSPAAVVLGGKLYAIGGRSGPKDFGDVLVYDAASNVWSAGPSVDPRATCGAIAHDGSIYLFGGESQARSRVLADVLRLPQGATIWQTATPMPTARSFARSVLFKDAVYVIGGSPEPQTSHAPRGTSVVERLELSAESSQPAAKPAFLIVTPAALRPALLEYAAHRRAEMPTDLVNLEDILSAAPGADEPEKLKHYLYQAWREKSVRYVLLVGDADTLPVRYMVLDRATAPAFDYAFYPSDLYYADVARPDGAFDDWNARKDDFHAGYFGEVRGEKIKTDPINYDQIDYRPELALGRWPVSTLEETKTVVAKTLAYEKGLRAGDKPNSSRAALLAVGGWIENRPAVDELAAQLSPRWTIEKRYFKDANRNDQTPPPDDEHVVELLNTGLGLLLHSGHGADDAWADCISVRSLKRIHNTDRLPIIFSAGCSTARFATLPPYEAYIDIAGIEHRGTNNGEVFDQPPPPPACYQKGKHNPTGLGEQLLRAGPDGAVAYIGCNTGSQPCGMSLMAGFVDAMHNHPDRRLGDCWAGAIAYYYDHEHLADLKPNADWYPPSIFFQGMKFMLFGDPTLPLPDPAAPSPTTLPARR